MPEDFSRTPLHWHGRGRARPALLPPRKVRPRRSGTVSGRHVTAVSFVKHLMDEGDGDRSLADGGCHALDMATPDIADREHSGETRFEEIGRPRERPLGGGHAAQSEEASLR
jgi:hypothetical protein